MNATVLEFVKSSGGRIINGTESNSGVEKTMQSSISNSNSSETTEMMVEKSKEYVETFRLMMKSYITHSYNKEVRMLRESNVGRFVQFKSHENMTSKIHDINRAAFVGGCRLVFLGRGKKVESRGIGINRYVADITKQPREKYNSIFGSVAFSELVSHVLFLEANGVAVPKLNQAGIIFKPKTKPEISNILEYKSSSDEPDPDHVTTQEEVTSTPRMESHPQVTVASQQVEPATVQEVVQTTTTTTAPLATRIFSNPEFNQIRETVNAMYLADLLNDRIRAEINSIILEKLFNTDFVEEILNNNF